VAEYSVLLMHSTEGRCYSTGEMAAYLTGAGFRDPAYRETAAARGIFGAPSFLVGDELFWGNDRLDDAVAWALAAQA